MSDTAIYLLATLAKAIILIGALLTAFAYLTLIERRVVAFMQTRWGPNRVGPFGLLQPLADALKMVFKEQIIPTKGNELTKEEVERNKGYIRALGEARKILG